MLAEHTSALSFASKLMNAGRDEINLNEMSDDELRLTLEEAVHTNRTLTLENNVFERYLRRKAPQTLHKLSQVVESARQAQKVSRLRAPQVPTGNQSLASSMQSLGRSSAKASSTPSLASGQLARTASGSQHGVGGGSAPKRAKGLKLTCAHRIELADNEVDFMMKDYNAFEKYTDKKKTGMQAQLEEMTFRKNETIEAAKHFEKTVVAEQILSKIPMESFIRFMDEQFKIAAIIVDKLNLKTVTAKRLIDQTKKQLAQRSNFGSDLQRVDFEKLEIENQYLIEENEWNQNTLTSLKKIGGFYNLKLKNCKDDLLDKKMMLQSIQNELLANNRDKVDLQRCQIETAREVRSAAEQLNHIKELVEEYEIPKVNDFFLAERQLQEARRNFKRLSTQRKLKLLAK